MRIYTTLQTAILEIRRDLTRALPHTTLGVQQYRDRELESREALNYQYSIPLEEGAVPDFEYFASLFRLINPEAGEPEILRWWKWLPVEVEARFMGGLAATIAAAQAHPLEPHFREGMVPSYLYPQRISACGGFDQLTELLVDDPTSRRAYLPIFHPEDSMRAALQTRVPCSLGYHYIIRSDGLQDRLHATYLMRSCDFDTFWLMDVIIASRLALELFVALRDHPHGPDLSPGNLVHTIISFHMLRDPKAPGGEIY